MNPDISETQVKQIVEINWTDRWQVYKRLQELEISSSCKINQPLTVEIANITDIAQLWSVLRQFTASRQDLISHLQHSWHLPNHSA